MAEILDENTRLRELSTSQSELLVAQQAQLQQQSELLAKQAEALKRLHELEAQVAALTSSNELLAKHFEFLAKKRKLAATERYIADQRQVQLFAEGEVTLPPRDAKVAEEDAARPDEATDGRKTAKHRRKGRRKVEDLDLPKNKVIAPVTPSNCTSCGAAHQPTESKVTHRVEWQPGRFVVLEVHQEQVTCACPKHNVWTAPAPFLLPSSMCGDGLLTRVVLDKFGDHMPLHRQSARMKREGFAVGSNVLSGWVRQGAREVRPLVLALQAQVTSGSLLQSDDSGFPVQDGSDGRLANGRLWVFTDQKQAFYGFSRTKEGEHPAALLASLDVSGKLVADGGSEYNLTETTLELERGGCWSHLRRYFFDASVQHEDAKPALTAIRDLFLIERDLVDLTLPERLTARGDRARPIVDGFFSWVKEMSPKERPKSKLGRALGYAISQESRMRLFLDHGDVPIHNNLSELLLRQPIVGRKNWLFAGSEGGAKAAAGWFSLIASCLLQGIDPQTYLYDVFRRLPSHPSKWVHELTPLNWRLAVEAGDIIPMSPGQLA